jgi:tRNA(Ile)-lysidine synthase
MDGSEILLLPAHIQRFIQKEKLLEKGQSLICGVSGGLDSMVLAFILHNLGYKVEIAHFNFGLRGADSDLDEALVKSFATANGIQFHRNSVEPSFFEGKSIQVEARNLRYQWFQDLAKSLNIHAIATAHHADDQIETVFLQTLRGTGISGYRGILPKQNLLIRPLLQVSKSELEDFAISSGISWREDVSNQKTDYKRNKIRLEL